MEGSCLFSHPVIETKLTCLGTAPPTVLPPNPNSDLKPCNAGSSSAKVKLQFCQVVPQSDSAGLHFYQKSLRTGLLHILADTFYYLFLCKLCPLLSVGKALSVSTLEVFLGGEGRWELSPVFTSILQIFFREMSVYVFGLFFIFLLYMYECSTRTHAFTTFKLKHVSFLLLNCVFIYFRHDQNFFPLCELFVFW